MENDKETIEHPWPVAEDGTEILPVLYYIWCWFNDLTGWRMQGMSMGPISHLEVWAWTQLTNIVISPSEVEALRAIDLKFCAYVHEKNKPDKAIGTIGSQLQAIRDEHDRQEQSRAQARARAAAKGK